MFRKKYQRIQPSKTPQLLYKYTYFDKKGHHLQILKERTLWFSSAKKFNDPFDSSIIYRFDKSSYKVKYKWADSVIREEQSHLSNAQRHKMIIQRLSEIDNDSDYFSQTNDFLISKNYQKFGICSLTATHNNLLMWAHYANFHTGFVVGLDNKEILKMQEKLAKIDDVLLNLYSIEYKTNQPMIKFYKSMLSKSWEDDIIKLLISKSIHWRYEKEFRLIYWNKVNFNLEIEPNLIKELYLGCKIDEDDKKRIMKIALGYPTYISIYQAKKETRRFELLFEKIN